MPAYLLAGCIALTPKSKGMIHPNGWSMHRRKGGQSDRYAAAKAVNSARARSLDESKLLECSTLCASMWQALHSALRLQGSKARACISSGRPAHSSIGRIWCTSVAMVVSPFPSQSSQTGCADRYAARKRRQRLELIKRVYSLVLCLFILEGVAGETGEVGAVAGIIVMRVRVMRLVMSHVRALVMSGS